MPQALRLPWFFLSCGCIYPMGRFGGSGGDIRSGSGAGFSGNSANRLLARVVDRHQIH